MTQSILALPDSDIAPVTEGAAGRVALNNCERGDISEEMFDVEARRRGWLVASGRGKGRDFDSIVKRPSLIRPVSVQTKLAHWYEDKQSYLVRCATAQTYSATAFDVLAVHLADRNQFVFFLRSELGNRVGFRYQPLEFRKKRQCRGAVINRDPNNWELLDQVAATNSQESSGVSQQMSDPLLNI